MADSPIIAARHEHACTIQDAVKSAASQAKHALRGKMLTGTPSKNAAGQQRYQYGEQIKRASWPEQLFSTTKVLYRGAVCQWLRRLTLIYWDQGFDSAVMEGIWLDGAALQIDKSNLR